jgi:hypothetical protein
LQRLKKKEDFEAVVDSPVAKLAILNQHVQNRSSTVLALIEGKGAISTVSARSRVERRSADRRLASTEESWDIGRRNVQKAGTRNNPRIQITAYLFLLYQL